MGGVTDLLSVGGRFGARSGCVGGLTDLLSVGARFGARSGFLGRYVHQHVLGEKSLLFIYSVVTYDGACLFEKNARIARTASA